MMKEIKKFEFIEFSTGVIPEIEEAVLVNTIEQAEAEVISETFADQNTLEELGQPLVKEINFIRITQEELDENIAKAKDEAIAAYIQEQAEVIEDNRDDEALLEEIANIVKEIRDRVNIEFEDILEKLLQLSFTIASKVIDIQLMNLKQKDCIDIIKSKISELDFHSGIRVEVRDEALAQALSSNGIEVSINSDMLLTDYKIVWCNGFFERKATEITAHIEEILIDQIKK